MNAEVQKRWSTFLDKIESAFDELMREGRAGCLDLLQSNELDPIAMSNAWQGIRAEMFALADKIGTTWREKVEATFDAAGVPKNEIYAEEARGRALDRQIRHTFERREIELFAEGGDLIYAAATKAMQKSLHCRECGADLVLHEKFFRAVNVTCGFCQRVNTLEPGSEVRMVENYCSHHLSQRAALAEWEALKAVEQRRRDTRGDTIEVLRALELATRNYWTAYFQARAQLIPDFSKDLARDIESRMRPFRDEMQNNAVWLASPH
jgi:hypothetical protein